MYTIYYHKSPSNKYYIGQTKQKITVRWKLKGAGYLKKNKDGAYVQPKFALAIQKHGWDNFEHGVLQDNISTKEEADVLEQQFIVQYNSIKHGYNISTGGGGCSGHKVSEKSKKIMRQIKLEAFKDKEYKNKINQACYIFPVQQYTLTGELVAEYKNAKEAALQFEGTSANILSVVQGHTKSAFGYYWRKKTNKEVNIPKDNRFKAVEQYTMDNMYIKTWKTAREAYKSLGISYNEISRCCLKQRKSAKNYKWCFEGDSLDTIERKHPIRRILMCDSEWNVIAEYSNAAEASKTIHHTNTAILNACKKHLYSFGYYWKFKD